MLGSHGTLQKQARFDTTPTPRLPQGRVGDTLILQRSSWEAVRCLVLPWGRPSSVVQWSHKPPTVQGGKDKAPTERNFIPAQGREMAFSHSQGPGHSGHSWNLGANPPGFSICFQKIFSFLYGDSRSSQD